MVDRAVAAAATAMLIQAAKPHYVIVGSPRTHSGPIHRLFATIRHRRYKHEPAMENFICVQCGTQLGETAQPPSRCLICDDERQFVNHDGQQWTTLEHLVSEHHNRFEDEAPQLLGIGTEPEFAIGQRALLLQSDGGNLLWDCISLLDDKTIAEVSARGDIRAIAISHPHFYSSMVEWAEHFDAQIFLHAADREWVDRKSTRLNSSHVAISYAVFCLKKKTK